MEEKLKYFDNKFNDIIKHSQHFLMNQTSDIVDNNKFNHVSFLGNIPVKDIIEYTTPMAATINDVIDDKYIQMFIRNDIFSKNENIFENSKNDTNYKIVEDYSEVFNGLIRVDKYYILANSSIIKNSYNVYILIDSNSEVNLTINNKNTDFEFYGLIKIGYIINPRGYNEDEIVSFEKEMNFVLKNDFKEYIKKTSIIKYENKLFHINLDYNSYDNVQKDKLKKVFEYSDKKIVSNNKFLEKYKKVLEYSNEEYNNIIKEEYKYMDNTNNGCLCIGLLKKQMIEFNNKIELKSEKRVYLLLNCDSLDLNYNFSIWTHTYENKNYDKLLDSYDVDNNQVVEYEESEFIKRENIFQTFKHMENIII